MTKIQDNPESELAELERTFQEYKSRLKLAEQQSKELLDHAREEAENIVAGQAGKAQQIADEIRQSARLAGEQIVLEARDKADKIVKEANDIAKREAKDKTKREIERIIDDARRVAEKQSAEIIAQSKKEAEQIVKEVKESIKVAALKESEEIVFKAQEDAEKIRKNSIASATEINKLIAEALQKADNILGSFKKQVQDELSELILAIGKAKDDSEIRSGIDKVNIGAKKDVEDNEISGNAPFIGRRELKILPPYDIMQIKRLVESVKQIPDIKLDGEAATEDDYSIYIRILEPLPLMTILREMSLIASSDVKGEKIKLSLNPP